MGQKLIKIADVYLSLNFKWVVFCSYNFSIFLSIAVRGEVYYWGTIKIFFICYQLFDMIWTMVFKIQAFSHISWNSSLFLHFVAIPFWLTHKVDYLFTTARMKKKKRKKVLTPSWLLYDFMTEWYEKIGHLHHLFPLEVGWQGSWNVSSDALDKNLTPHDSQIPCGSD